MIVLGVTDPGQSRELGQAGSGVVRRRFQNMEMPLLSVGGERLPTSPNGRIDMAHLERMIDYGMQNGVNFFDTAWTYFGGESEAALGRVLRNYRRESFYLCNKSPLYVINSKDDVRRLFDQQLRRCQVDFFDFYMAHNINTRTQNTFYGSNVYEELVKIKEEGLIKHLGFSYHGTEELLYRVANEFPWEFSLIQLNYMNWPNTRRNYQVLENANIPVIAITPLGSGALTRLPDSAAAVPRNYAPQDTQASFGLRWVSGRQNVVSMLSGMTSLKDMQENVETFRVGSFRPWTPEEENIAARVARML
jgi:predicted aldo/keto reductase-like oxidoreductase